MLYVKDGDIYCYVRLLAGSSARECVVIVSRARDIFLNCSRTGPNAENSNSKSGTITSSIVDEIPCHRRKHGKRIGTVSFAGIWQHSGDG